MAMQRLEDGQEIDTIELGVLVASTTAGDDHDPLLQLRAFPLSSVAMQKLEVGQDTEAKALMVSIALWLDQPVPFQLRAFPL